MVASFNRILTIIAATLAACSAVSASPLPPLPFFQHSQPAPAITLPQAQKSLENRSATFIENKGQWDRQVKFLLKSPGLDMWITEHGVRYDLFTLTASEKKDDHDALIMNPKAEPPAMTRSGHVVDISFEGAGFAPTARGIQQQPGGYNYFIGNDSKKWTSGVRLFAKAQLENLYNGIDALFYLDEGRPRYDLIVAPGADPAQVQMKIEGSNGVSINTDGSLAIRTSMGVLQQRGLFAYQVVDGVRRQVECRFKVGGDKRVRFDVGDYDRSIALVIDPLVYSTFLGGNGADLALDIQITSTGEAIVYGHTDAPNFPTTSGVYDQSYNRKWDLYITKLNATGTTLIYSTYIGGDSSEYSTGIALDKNENTYITGITYSADFPTTSLAFDQSYNGQEDAFIAKIDMSGSNLSYSTYIGGTHEDRSNAIIVDASGSAYITGYTRESSNYPTTGGAFQTSNEGNYDAFVTKINESGSTLSYSTLIGGDSRDEATSIALDDNGNAYITGRTSSSDFPTTIGTYKPKINTYLNLEVFVSKLNASGSALVFSTFIGVTFSGNASGIAVDNDGNSFITGWTYVSAYPTTKKAFDTSFSGLSDAFITKLNASGNALIYSTFIGGSTFDGRGVLDANDIAVDNRGNATIVGRTVSPDFPTTANAFDRTYNNGNYDGFVTTINEDGSKLVYSTFLGSIQNDRVYGVAVDSIGNAYATGYFLSYNYNVSLDFPTTSGAYLQSANDYQDAFVSKFQILKILRITSSASTGGTISPNGTTTGAFGSSITFTIAPDSGYAIDEVFVDSSSVGAVSSYTFSELQSDHSISATFKKLSLGLPDQVLSQAPEDCSLLVKSVAPNPTRNELQVSFTILVSTSVTMEIFGSDGGLVSTPLQAEPYESGAHTLNIRVAVLPPGVYMLRILASDKSFSHQFVVVR